jgi:hypothetical protein
MNLIMQELFISYIKVYEIRGDFVEFEDCIIIEGDLNLVKSHKIFVDI